MKILLTGDSWAAGAWSNPLDTTFFSPILVDLLENDGHSVLHCPYPRSSDLPSLTCVQKYHDQVDFVIFFKTQCSRMLIRETSACFYDLVKGSDWPSFDDYKKMYFTNTDQEIINEMQQLGFFSLEHLLIDYAKKGLRLDEIFHKINQKVIYKKLFDHNSKILLIGGCESIQTEYQFDYVIDDLISFLTGEPNNNFTLSSAGDFVTIYKLISNSDLRLEIKNQLIEDFLETHDNNKLLETIFFKNKNFFGPNDTVHPNETAIKLYYQECIKPKLEEFENDHRTNHQSQ